MFAVVGYVVFFLYLEGWGADWKLFLATTDEQFYYDTESIAHPSEGVVRVWCKQVYTEQGEIDMAGALEERFKTLSYWMDSLEFHCTDKKVRRLFTVAYFTDEEILHSFDYQEPEWHFISPGSVVADILYSIVCK